MIWGVVSTMVFIRIKQIKGICYAYWVKNVWVPGKGSRQKVVAYIGRVKGLDRFNASAIFKRDAYTCQLCGWMQDLTIDHKLPISKGGSNDLSNLWTLCRSCNSRKKDRVLEEPKPEQIREGFYY
ncbi:hypothetical protein LCGC14_0485140 [marine sediment metagenome]|uniref:HNH nuclease domain-containing protein n=1 Tax=marine sediment metagenome TaxID=412755 RepID=A0A0F9UVD6_9ZZZZ